MPEASFDWVTARAECSAEQMFARLFDRVQADAQAIQARCGGGLEIKFTRSTGKFGVSKRYDTSQGVVGGEGVLFEMTADGVAVVRVNPDGVRQTQFEASVQLDATGRCRYVCQEPQELWQISRMALEPLFFG